MLIRLVEDESLPAHRIMLAGKVPSAANPVKLRFADKTLSIECISESHPIYARGTRKSRGHVEPTLYVSTHVRNALNLPSSQFLHARTQTDEWIIGPCLALYANPSLTPKRKFGEQTNMFRDLTILGRRLGVDVVVITPGFWKHRTGWRYSTDKAGWKQGRLPIPDIVLRRSGTFHKPWARVNEELAKFAHARKLHTLPRRVSNKWLFYREMCDVQQLKEHLPASHLAKTAEDVWNALMRHRDVYVKPLTGAQGISIYRLTWNGMTGIAQWEERIRKIDGQFDVEQKLFRTVREEVWSDKKAFSQFWDQTGLRMCIVQETVRLPRTKEGRPFDFRWLLQNSEDIQVMARVARVGRVQSVTTNIHTGAEAMDAQSILETSGWSHPENAIEKLDQVACNVANALRRKYGPFAELGVDLAVREDGRIVVFEVNPTPGRRMLRTLSGPVREMSLDCLLEYAITAAGFANRLSE